MPEAINYLWPLRCRVTPLSLKCYWVIEMAIPQVRSPVEIKSGLISVCVLLVATVHCMGTVLAVLVSEVSLY